MLLNLGPISNLGHPATLAAPADSVRGGIHLIGFRVQNYPRPLWPNFGGCKSFPAKQTRYLLMQKRLFPETGKVQRQYALPHRSVGQQCARQKGQLFRWSASDTPERPGSPWAKLTGQPFPPKEEELEGAKLNGVYSFEASVSPSYAGELARTNLPSQLLLSGINHPPKKQGRQLLRR